LFQVIADLLQQVDELSEFGLSQAGEKFLFERRQRRVEFGEQVQCLGRDADEDDTAVLGGPVRPWSRKSRSARMRSWSQVRAMLRMASCSGEANGPRFFNSRCSLPDMN
jgi:hypothetical protein